MRRRLKWLHKWAGILLAVYIALIAGTGAALTFRQPILAAAHDLPKGATRGALANAERLYGELDDTRITAITLPTPEFGAFAVHRRGFDPELFDAADLNDVDGVVPAVFTTIYDLHHRLALGQTGETLSGWLGTGFLVLAGVGLALWWPMRRGFAVRRLWTSGPSRMGRLAVHVTLGPLLAIPLLLLSASGVAMIFHEQAATLLAPVAGSDGRVE
ncbi:MAG: PepSY-associated TM helix domain-containing protein, partial [Pacificimonas sp.]